MSTSRGRTRQARWCLGWVAAGVAAAGLTGLPARAAGPAWVAGPNGQVMSPGAWQGWLRHQAAQRRAEAAAPTLSPSAAPLDTLAPVLTAFSANTQVDAADPTQRMSFSFTVVDDLAGLEWVNIRAVSPSGQTAAVYIQGLGRTTVSGRVGYIPVGQAEPGVWRVVQVNGGDGNGNYFDLDEPALATLGNTRYTVLNARGGDMTPPVLTGGRVTTPEVGVRSTARGTAAESPYVRAELSLKESASGVQVAQATFCKPDYSGCITLVAQDHMQHKRPDGTRILGNRLNAGWGLTAADYYIESVHLIDGAGNTAHYQSQRFAGADPLEALFSVPVLRLR